MFKEEIKSLQSLKAKLLLRIQELEEELKSTKEEAEKLAKSSKSDDEVSVLIIVIMNYRLDRGMLCLHFAEAYVINDPSYLISLSLIHISEPTRPY